MPKAHEGATESLKMVVASRSSIFGTLVAATTHQVVGMLLVYIEMSDCIFRLQICCQEALGEPFAEDE